MNDKEKTMKNLLGLLAIAAFAGNCLMQEPTAPPLPSAFLYSSVTASVNCAKHGEAGCASEKDGKDVGAKSGTSCAMAILGFFQVGDMSLKAAAAEGKITQINSVDYSQTNALGSLYFQKCLIVNGK